MRFTWRLVLVFGILFTGGSVSASGKPCNWHTYKTPRGVGQECIVVNEKKGLLERITKDPIANTTVKYWTLPRGTALKKGAILADDTGYPGKSVLEYIGPERVVIRIKGSTPGVTLYR